MKVRILGCGTSTGVPKIGNEWGRCDPAEPRNRRLRSSILFQSADQSLLVDCGPDLREQLLAAEVDRVDALIVTHSHGDHVHGIDDLRPLAAKLGAPIPLHARAQTLAQLERSFAYAFAQSDFYRPIVVPHAVGETLTFGNSSVRFVDQRHGSMWSLGMRFDQSGKAIGYAVDFNDFSDDMAALYKGVDVWIADCLMRDPHPTHFNLDALVGVAREIGVGQLYLTHMGNGLDYRTILAELPDWAAPAHDGLEISL